MSSSKVWLLIATVAGLTLGTLRLESEPADEQLSPHTESTVFAADEPRCLCDTVVLNRRGSADGGFLPPRLAP